MRARTLLWTALGLGATLAGAWALGAFREPAAGPAPAGDDGDDAAVAGARLSTTGARPKAADPAAAPRAAPNAVIFGVVRAGADPVVARVEAWLLANSATLEYAQVQPIERLRAYVADSAAKPAAAVSSGADGRFALEGLAVGLYEVTAVGTAGGAAHLQARIPADGARVGLSLQLFGGGETLRGRVLRADGTPWRGLVATPPASSPTPRAAAAVQTRTDDQGRFVLAGLPVGLAQIVAVEPGVRLWQSRPVALPRSSEWTWTLPADVECAGSVVAASDGKPIAGAVVICDARAGGEVEDALVATTTDDQGRFRLARPGPSWLSATAAGFRKGGLTVRDAGETPTIRLVRSSRLSGRVLADADGGPVPGVTVTARAVEAWDPVPATATSAADGSYELSEIGGGDVRVFAVGGGWISKGMTDVREGGYNPLVTTVPIEGKGTFDVVVTRGGRVEGRVLSPDGTPHPGATVTPTLTGNARQMGWLLASLIAASGAAGEFVVEGLPPGAMFEVTASEVGFLSVKAGPFRADPAAPVKTELRLGGGTFFDAIVVERGTKTPVPGARLTAWSWDAGGAGGASPEVVSGADGHARVGPVSGANGNLQVSAPGHGGAYVALSRIAEGSVTVELEVTRTCAITGHVEFADGGSTSGLNLTVTLQAADRTDQEQCDDDGSFRFADVPPGPAKLTAQMGWQEGAPITSIETTAGTEDLRIVLPLPRPPSITVQVTDAAGTAVPAFKAISFGVEGNGYVDGRDGRIELQGVRKEAWLFVFVAKDATGAPLPLAATVAGPFPAGRSPVQVTLAPERVIEGSVTGSDGAGLRGVALAARSLSLPTPLSAAGSVPVGQARTDERGTFRIGGLGPGEYALSVSPSPEYPVPPPVSVAAGQTHVDVSLARGAAVEITVLSSEGRPVSGATATARPPGQRARLAPTGATDASGVVRLAGLDPTVRYELRVDPPRGGGAGMWKKIPAWSPRNEVVRLEPALKIRGVFRRPDGKPIAGAGVNLRASSGPSDDTAQYAQTDTQGAFAFEAVGQGSYRLAASVSNPRFEAEAVVEAGAQDVVLVGIECPGKLVVTFQGWPEADTQTWVQVVPDGAPRDDEGGRGGQVAHASVTIEGLRTDATYTLYAALSGGLVAYAKGLGTGSATVTCKPGKTIQGRVKAPSTRAGLNAYVSHLWAYAKFEPDGSYVISSVPDGTWTVDASAQVGEGWWSAEGTVEAGGTLDLELKPR